VAGTCEHGNDNSGFINENFLTSREAVRFAVTILIQRGGQSVCHRWLLRVLGKDLVRLLTYKYVRCGPG